MSDASMVDMLLMILFDQLMGRLSVNSRSSAHGLTKAGPSADGPYPQISMSPNKCTGIVRSINIAISGLVSRCLLICDCVSVEDPCRCLRERTDHKSVREGFLLGYLLVGVCGNGRFAAYEKSASRCRVP